MLEFADAMPITLEALDAEGGVLSGMAAGLRHLDGERAIVTLSLETPTPHLQWGARVRFQVADGLQRYSVLGTVIAHDRPHTTQIYDRNGTEEPAQFEATLQLWECRPADQQRLSPRRTAQCDILFYSLDPEHTGAEVPEGDVWVQGVCVDIGGGGLRLRAPASFTPPKRLALRFTLAPPDSDEAAGREFRLQGRVLRITPTKHDADSQEIAVRFEHLSVAEGMALAACLA
ncbi:MAG TPA: PilZ domain-containing protein [Chthonomonadaceae bacterium]|nr:PilZ domain-containing protein [Chthonomonadaceae bacterium]